MLRHAPPLRLVAIRLAHGCAGLLSRSVGRFFNWSIRSLLRGLRRVGIIGKATHNIQGAVLGTHKEIHHYAARLGLPRLEFDPRAFDVRFARELPRIGFTSARRPVVRFVREFR